MEFNIGDKVIYEDLHFNIFKGEVVDIWEDDDGVKTAYFLETDSGLHIHLKAGSLEWCRLDKSVPVS